MKKIIIVLFAIFLVSCSVEKQDMSKLEEFSTQYRVHVRQLAQHIYWMKESSVFWKEKEHKVAYSEEILQKAKQLQENCVVIVDKNLQNECKNILSEEIWILEKIFAESFTKHEDLYKKYSENRKIFENNLKMYWDKEKLQ